MNKVILKGFLIKDPELATTKSDTSLCKFTIAINRRFKKEESDLINCIAWKQMADFIEKYFKKGSEIAIVGRIEIDKYVDKDGKTQYRANINVEEAYFCGKKSDKKESDNSQPTQTNQNNKQQPATNKQYKKPDSTPEIDDDELPF